MKKLLRWCGVLAAAIGMVGYAAQSPEVNRLDEVKDVKLGPNIGGMLTERTNPITARRYWTNLPSTVTMPAGLVYGVNLTNGYLTEVVSGTNITSSSVQHVGTNIIVNGGLGAAEIDGVNGRFGSLTVTNAAAVGSISATTNVTSADGRFGSLTVTNAAAAGSISTTTNVTTADVCTGSLTVTNAAAAGSLSTTTNVTSPSGLFGSLTVTNTGTLGGLTIITNATIQADLRVNTGGVTNNWNVGELNVTTNANVTGAVQTAGLVVTNDTTTGGLVVVTNASIGGQVLATTVTATNTMTTGTIVATTNAYVHANLTANTLGVTNSASFGGITVTTNAEVSGAVNSLTLTVTNALTAGQIRSVTNAFVGDTIYGNGLLITNGATAGGLEVITNASVHATLRADTLVVTNAGSFGSVSTTTNLSTASVLTGSLTVTNTGALGGLTVATNANVSGSIYAGAGAVTNLLSVGSLTTTGAVTGILTPKAYTVATLPTEGVTNGTRVWCTDVTNEHATIPGSELVYNGKMWVTPTAGRTFTTVVCPTDAVGREFGSLLSMAGMRSGFTLDNSGLYTGNTNTGFISGEDLIYADQLIAWDWVGATRTYWYLKLTGFYTGWVDVAYSPAGTTVIPPTDYLQVLRQGAPFAWRIPASTNVPTFDGTGTAGYIPYLVDTNSLSDSPMSRLDANTVKLANLSATTNITAADVTVTNTAKAGTVSATSSLYASAGAVTNNWTVAGQVLTKDGALGSPAIAAASNPDLGFMLASDAINTVVNGANIFYVNAGGAAVNTSLGFWAPTITASTKFVGPSSEISGTSYSGSFHVTNNMSLGTSGTFMSAPDAAGWKVAGGANADRMKITGVSRALTNNVATTIFKISCATNQATGCTIFFQTKTIDAAYEIQANRGQAEFAIVNQAGTMDADIETYATQFGKSSGTCTVAWSITQDGTNAIVLLNANSDLTPTTHEVRYTVFTDGEASIITPL